jgi:flagellar biosynthesis/type III secretory pathway chaperone
MQVVEMTKRVREMVAVLREQTGVYRELLTVAVREREAVRRGGEESIRGLCTERERLKRRLQPLEERRLRIVQALAPECACRPEEVTVSRIAAGTSAELRAQLLRCRDELVEITERLRVENRRTALLLEHAGELLQASYRVLRGMAARCGPVYRRGGQVQGARLHGKLVCNDI